MAEEDQGVIGIQQPHILDDGDRSLMDRYAQQNQAEAALAKAVKEAIEADIDIESIISKVRTGIKQSKGVRVEQSPVHKEYGDGDCLYDESHGRIL